MGIKHFDFLDFIIKELYKLPNGEQISKLYEKYSKATGFKIDENELDNFIEQNDGEYYYIIGNPDLAEITEKGKQIIYTYGSLSSEEINKKNKTPQNKPKARLTKVWYSTKKSIIAIIITVIGGFLLYLIIEWYKSLSNV